MDDFDTSLSGTRPKTNLEEAWHNSQKRKQYDTIRVKNPTDEDFYVMYDTNQYQRVPKQATIDVPFHIAVRYVQHMKDKIINDRAKKMHDDFLLERQKKGLPMYTDKAVENNETYMLSTFPKTNDPKLIKEIYSDLWVGTVAFYGRDLPPEQVDTRSGEVDLTPVDTKVLDSLRDRRVDMGNTPHTAPEVNPPPYITNTYVPPQVSSPFADMNDKLDASEITNNE